MVEDFHITRKPKKMDKVRRTGLLYTEMEFLDINSIQVLLLHAIHSPLYWRFLKKTILYSGFNNPYKKFSKQENWSLFLNSIL
jgi:hypothetical protein